MDVFLGNSLNSLSPLLATFVLAFSTLVLLLGYSLKKQSYWKNLGIPYANSYLFVGSILQTFYTPIQFIEEERYRKLGKIYGHYEGNRALLSVGDPELLRSIMVKDFPVFSGRRKFPTRDKLLEKMVSLLQGEDWKRVRTIISPTFTTGKIKKMTEIFKECSRTLVKNFREAAEKREYIDAKRLYGAYTMDVIASSAFSTKIDSHSDPNNEFVLTAKQAFATSFNFRIFLIIFLPHIANFLKLGFFKDSVKKFFTNATLQIIEERKRTGQTKNDFLQLMMDTAKELQDEGKLDLQEKENDIAANYAEEENKEVFKNVTKKTLSFDELVAQCVIFFIGGYETSATTLAMISYNLAIHPEIQERVIQELDDAVKENQGNLTYEVVQSLKTLDNVISETLRLYSPAIRAERVADENYALGDTGIIIPKGMIVTIPIYAIHRDPEHFPDPEKFDPDRFNPEERAKRHQYSYMPFGMGPRNCVAMRFALMEVKVCLAYVLCNFRFKRGSKTKVPLDFFLGQGLLLQPKAINLEIEIRKDLVEAI